MRLERYFSRKRILELEGDNLEDCLKELLKVSTNSFKDLERKQLLPGLMQRESTMTTYLGNGVALPHLRVNMNRRYVFAVGLSRNGIEYEGPKNREKVHLVILLLAGEKARDYLNVLATVAQLVKDKTFIEGLIASDNLDSLHRNLVSSFGGIFTPQRKGRQSSQNRLMFRQAIRIAKGAQCGAIAVFGDTMYVAPVDVPEALKDFKAVLVTRRAKEGDLDDENFAHVIQARSFSKGRLSQARSAFLVGMTRGIFEVNDKVCCIGGLPGSELFDTIVVVDLRQEFQALLSERETFVPSGVSPEVFERVIGVAMELAVEGREGKPIGTLFVLGDTKKVEGMAKPLILNPFFGYKEEDRNILSPFMDETVKEFSSLDGAFIIRGDGVLMSAGSLIHAPDYYHSLPGGLGSRHAAGAAISVATDCVAIVVSSSTGQVTIFRNGTALSLMDKSLAGYSH